MNFDAFKNTKELLKYLDPYCEKCKKLFSPILVEGYVVECPCTQPLENLAHAHDPRRDEPK